MKSWRTEMKSRSIVRAIADGDFDRAYIIARGPAESVCVDLRQNLWRAV
jgi:hypothetical protein